MFLRSGASTINGFDGSDSKLSPLLLTALTVNLYLKLFDSCEIINWVSSKGDKTFVPFKFQMPWSLRYLLTIQPERSRFTLGFGSGSTSSSGSPISLISSRFRGSAAAGNSGRIYIGAFFHHTAADSSFPLKK
jgi:hypothetical protein